MSRSDVTKGDYSGGLSREKLRPLFDHQVWLSSAEEFGERLVIDGKHAGKKWGRMRLDGTDLSKSSLRHVIFRAVSLKGVRFAGAELSGVVFESCDLSGADFRKSKLDDVSFGGSNFDKADFSDTDTSRVDWKGKAPYSFRKPRTKSLTL